MKFGSRSVLKTISIATSILFAIGLFEYVRYCWFGGEGGLVMRMEAGLPVYESGVGRFGMMFTFIFLFPVLLLGLIKAFFFRRHIHDLERFPFAAASCTFVFDIQVFLFINYHGDEIERKLILLFIAVSLVAAFYLSKFYLRLKKS